MEICSMLTRSVISNSVPYKRKKLRKVRNFFRHFRTEILRIPAFFLPPKTGVFSPAKNRRFCFPPKTVDSRGSRRLALLCRRNHGEKLQNLDEGPFFFFFWRSHLNRKKMMRKFSAFSH